METSAFNIAPLARAAAKTSPSTIREKYSAGPNFSAILVSGMANPATISVPTVPAKKEPSAEMPSATPARPCFAISCPSMQVIVELASPEIDISMAVVELPYWAP